MELVEMIVNHHANVVRNAREAARNERIRRHLSCVRTAACVAVGCLLATLFDLMHPGLAYPMMVVSLMIGSYHLGRCVRFGKAVR